MRSSRGKGDNLSHPKVISVIFVRIRPVLPPGEGGDVSGNRHSG